MDHQFNDGIRLVVVIEIGQTVQTRLLVRSHPHGVQIIVDHAQALATGDGGTVFDGVVVDAVPVLVDQTVNSQLLARDHQLPPISPSHGDHRSRQWGRQLLDDETGEASNRSSAVSITEISFQGEAA